MNQATLKALRFELLKIASKKRQPNGGLSTDAWYQRSYPDFLRAITRAKTDAERANLAIAFAASWVGVIPTTAPQIPSAGLVNLHGQLSNPLLDQKGMHLALVTARTALGLKQGSNAVVMLSKVLHFLYPDLVPLYDKNVAIAWEKLVNLIPTLEPKSIRTKAVAKTAKSGPYLYTPNDFVQFWEVARQICADREFQWEVKRIFGQSLSTYRCLDEILFRYGKAQSKQSVRGGKSSKAKRVSGKSAPSKKDLALKIYQDSPNISRASILRRFQEEVGLSKAGASTYYHNLVSGRDAR